MEASVRSRKREEPRSMRGVDRMSRVFREEERFSRIRVKGGREREEEDSERDDRRGRGRVARAVKVRLATLVEERLREERVAGGFVIRQ
jgi:hypothetical protein